MMQEHVMGGYSGQINPYGIAAAMNSQQLMANQQAQQQVQQQAMQSRRYS
jgi:ATF/CREB family transcription factor